MAEATVQPGRRADAQRAEPRELPLVALRETVIFPEMIVPLQVGRDKSVAGAQRGRRRAARRSRSSPSARPTRRTSTTRPSSTTVGTLAKIAQVVQLQDGTVRAIVQGQQRIRVSASSQTEPYIPARDRGAARRAARDRRRGPGADAHASRRQIEQYVQSARPVPPEAAVAARNITEPGLLADMVAYSPDMTTEQRQELLETIDVVERLKLVSDFLARQIEILELKGKIQSEVKSEMDKTQREYILREQLKAIQRELGEDDPQQAEINELREKVEAGRHARGGQGPGDQGGRPDEPDPVRLARGRRHPDLRRLAGRPAVERLDRRPPRHQGGRQDPRRGPLRPREDQGAHPRVPRGAHARGHDPQPDPRLRRPARRRQDVARQERRPGHGPQVRPHEPRRHPRRGRDPRPPAHLHRRAARPDHPERQDGRHEQPRVHARRGRQDRHGLPWRSRRRPCSRCSTRSRTTPSRTTTSRCRSTCSKVLFIATGNLLDPIPAGPARPDGDHPAAGLHPAGEGRDRQAVPHPQADGEPRPRPPSTSRSPTRRWSELVQAYTKEAGVRNLEREIANIMRKVARTRGRGPQAQDRRRRQEARGATSARRASSTASSRPRTRPARRPASS